MSPVRIIDTPVEGGPLTAAALNGSAPPTWYPKPPSSVAEWNVRCRSVAAGNVDWLKELRPAFGAGATLLDRVANGQGVVVTTGQQAGLFGGPLYTWFKALTILEFAAALEKETGIPVVPVFWAATDDADFAEAASTVFAGTSGAEKLSLSERPGDGVPMSHAQLGAEVDALFARLEPVAGSVADDRALRAAMSFKPGATIGSAYVEMLRALLEPLGVAVLDASHAAVGAAAQPALSKALSGASAIHDALVERQSELRAANFPVPVEVDRPLSLVFAWESANGGPPHKRRITLDQATTFSSKVRLSPNVLLRPVVERMLLPTAAYLAGPGEIAYFAQVSAVADAMSVAQPLALPRWSGMIFPRDVDNALRRLKLDPAVLRDPHGAEGTLARAALAPSAVKALENLREGIKKHIAALDGELASATLDGAKDQLLRRADRLERRLLAAVKRREADAMRDVASARAVLFPFGKPQERALNIVPLWSRHGDELIAAIRAACAAHARRLIEGAAVSS